MTMLFLSKLTWYTQSFISDLGHNAYWGFWLSSLLIHWNVVNSCIVLYIELYFAASYHFSIQAYHLQIHILLFPFWFGYLISLPQFLWVRLASLPWTQLVNKRHHFLKDFYHNLVIHLVCVCVPVLCMHTYWCEYAKTLMLGKNLSLFSPSTV